MATYTRPGAEHPFTLVSTGAEVARLTIHADEATTAEAGGADAGHVVNAWALSFVSPDVSGQELAAVAETTGALTYLRVDASLVGASGPWTDIGTTPLAAPGALDAVVPVWVRVVTKHWGTDLSPLLSVGVRLRAAAGASVGA